MPRILTMSSIERRRKKRRLNLIIFIALAVLAAGGIAALAILIAGSSCKGAGEEAVFTEAPIVTQVPASEAAETPAPALTEPAETGEPVRVSDDQSEALLTLECARGYDRSGRFANIASGSMAISFLNNTDRTLYSAEFEVGEAQVLFASVGGVPVRFTLDSGRLTIPFVNELPINSSFDIAFSFEISAGDSDSFTLPNIAYDTSYSLTAFIDSDRMLTISGCEYDSAGESGAFSYTLSDQTVREVTVTFPR